ncbi:type VI secretion system Vgr family protein [Celerinatantimonas sp. MCCC 1A17872]|uniref:type VI secretion system Vgr family protein n=1 Tax=Celerinatantimonas sp. MCCC 1A17872 TaxID=3177514 RepID=UPI0038C50B0B
MAQSNQPKFTFVSNAIADDTFTVVRFTGHEGLSSLYQFEIVLLSLKNDIDFDDILQNSAVFTIKRESGDLSYHGIINSIEQLQQVDTYYFYRVSLVPKLWRATQTQHNQIFLDKSANEFISDDLKDAGLNQGVDFEFKLQKTYPTKEYICQYNESHFAFVSRWLEKNGMYYYFEQDEQNEKLIITDTHIAHSPMTEGHDLTYSAPTNLDYAQKDEMLNTFILSQKPLPKKVLLKDYNYQKPSLELKCEATVSSSGIGEVYIYGEHFQTIDEGNQLAEVRADEIRCRQKIFHAESSVPYIRPGYIFNLKGHYRSDFNQQYLTIEVTHEGNQESYLTNGLGISLSSDGKGLYYYNSFACIPSTTQYRAECKTEKSKFFGSMNAKIDAAGSGKYAELDDQGRYKVILPLDLSGRTGGKATAWFRMAQPYGGADHGMHFPLHKGTEVLLTCIDGDPDRPIIQAAVPNPEMPSQVTDANQTMSKITTAGQNKIHIEDKDGSQRILMQSPTSNSWMRIGAYNDPDKLGLFSGTGDSNGVTISSDSNIESYADKIKEFMASRFSFSYGPIESITLGNNLSILVGLKEDFSFGGALTINPKYQHTFKKDDFKCIPSAKSIKKSAAEFVDDKVEYFRSKLKSTGKLVESSEDKTELDETVRKSNDSVVTANDDQKDYSQKRENISESEKNTAENKKDTITTQNTVINKQTETVSSKTQIGDELSQSYTDQTNSASTMTVTADSQSTIVDSSSTIVDEQEIL